MDADIVREVEFSRSLRGYNMAEVDAFLEQMEGMFRRRDLEQENAEKKLQQELQKGTEQAARLADQAQQLALLTAELEEARKQTQDAQSQLSQAQEELDAERDRSKALQAELEHMRSALAAAQADAFQADQRSKVLEKSLEAQPQNRLAEVGAAAKDSLRKLSGTLRAMRK